jgi:hypothetical protein
MAILSQSNKAESISMLLKSLKKGEKWQDFLQLTLKSLHSFDLFYRKTSNWAILRPFFTLKGEKNEKNSTWHIDINLRFPPNGQCDRL